MRLALEESYHSPVVAQLKALVGGLGEPLRPYLSPDVAKRLVRPRRDAVDGAILLAGGTLDEAEGSP